MSAAAVSCCSYQNVAVTVLPPRVMLPTLWLYSSFSLKERRPFGSFTLVVILRSTSSSEAHDRPVFTH